MLVLQPTVQCRCLKLFVGVSSLGTRNTKLLLSPNISLATVDVTLFYWTGPRKFDLGVVTGLFSGRVASEVDREGSILLNLDRS